MLLLNLNISSFALLHPTDQERKTAQSDWSYFVMAHTKFWIFAICLGLLLMLASPAVARDMNSQDLSGIMPF